jgi:hypothetical protein
MKTLAKIAIPLLIVLFIGGITAVETAKSDSPKRQVIVYYFHHTLRCSSCIRMEELTKETVKKYFKKELADSLVVFRPVDTDEEDNIHFEEDYKLEFQQVILSNHIGGKEIAWKNLEKVWDLLHEEDDYRQYIRNELNKFIKDNK